MFYWFIAPGILSALFMGVKFYRLQKHDRVLYEFCELRRRLMRELRDRGFELSKDDYKSLRLLYDVLDDAIHDYSHYKTYVFNVRMLLKIARRYNETSMQMERIVIPTDERLKEIYFGYGRAMVNAFMSYTPFIKHEIFFKGLLAVLKILRDQYLNNGLRKVMKLLERLNRDRQEYLLVKG